ncbi:hypothetical protein ABZX12_41420 [Kribbella sp. NPDC003505]|uniref:hypothetical protein n=1 Tax=Kribbella sp. NPDC003505 TaxID=3154448 RepID=UPI0033B570DB
MESTWEGRDLPVLEKIVDYYDQYGESPQPSDLAYMLGWYEQVDDPDDAVEDVERALRALEHEQPPFITDLQKTASGEVVGIGAPTGHARRTVGAWPTPDILADRIIVALNEAADNEPDEVKKGKLRRAAEAVAGVGRDILTDVTAQVITKGMYGG